MEGRAASGATRSAVFHRFADRMRAVAAPVVDSETVEAEMEEEEDWWLEEVGGALRLSRPCAGEGPEWALSLAE